MDGKTLRCMAGLIYVGLVCEIYLYFHITINRIKIKGRHIILALSGFGLRWALSLHGDGEGFFCGLNGFMDWIVENLSTFGFCIHSFSRISMMTALNSKMSGTISHFQGQAITHRWYVDLLSCVLKLNYYTFSV